MPLAALSKSDAMLCLGKALRLRRLDIVIGDTGINPHTVNRRVKAAVTASFTVALCTGLPNNVAGELRSYCPILIPPHLPL